MILTFWLFSGALRAPEFSARAPEKSNFVHGQMIFSIDTRSSTSAVQSSYAGAVFVGCADGAVMRDVG